MPKSRLYGRHALAAVAALCAFLVYIPSLGNGFVEWDDTEYVLENPFIRSLGPDFFRWAFGTFHAANWHPLTWVSHAIDYAVWGLNPLGHHLTNSILHAVNTFLVVLLATKLIAIVQSNLESSDSSLFTLTAAGTTGLLFAVHPIHVESVAWVAERKDLLCALFYLLSLIFYTEYAAHGSGFGKPSERRREMYAAFADRTLLLALFLFFLALLSKPMAVSLPIVLIILDWYPLQRISSVKTFLSSILEKLPFIVLSILGSFLTLAAQGSAMRNLEPVAFSTRLLVATASLISYLWKMLYPVALIPYYPYPKNISSLYPLYLLYLLLVVAITAASLISSRKTRLWTAVWVYFVVTLIPVLGIVRVGGQAMADRYTYLPGIAPLLLAGLAAAWAAGKARLLQRPRLLLSGQAVILLIACLLLSDFTIRQTGVWKNSITLWSYVIAKQQGEVAVPFNNRGIAYEKMGRLDLAIEDFTRATLLNPGYYQAFTNRGAALQRAGRQDKAIADFKRAIALNPLYYGAYHNLGILYGNSGDLGRALENFDETVRIKPDYAQAYNNRGYIYLLLGRTAEALSDLNRAIALDQHYAQFFMNRATIYLRIGREVPALEDLRKACDLGLGPACSAVKNYRQARD